MGYKAAALDLFNGKVATDAGMAEKLMGEDKPESSLPKLKSVLEWMRSSDGLGAAKVATVGFCFGGGYSLQCALNFGDKVDGSVIYYGQLVTDPQALKACRAPLLGIFGKKDAWINPTMVQQFKDACRKAGVARECHEYEADHAFVNPINPKRYDAKLAKDAGEKTRAFLKRVLG